MIIVALLSIVMLTGCSRNTEEKKASVKLKGGEVATFNINDSEVARFAASADRNTTMNTTTSSTTPADMLADPDNASAELSVEGQNATVSPEEATEAVFRTNKGNFTLKLYREQMPITTGNFVKLASEGFYDNVKFHRVIPNFMIQAGDPLTKDDSKQPLWGTGGPGFTITDEFVDGLSNVRGTIAMANTGQPNSGGSQFFINVVDNTNLDFDKPPSSSKHPVFGEVTEGLDVVDAISKVPTTGGVNRPVEPVIILGIDLK